MSLGRAKRGLRVCTVAAMVLLARSASAGGLDGLRDAAKQASARGDDAAAVANLRRARQSVLAEGEDDALKAELERSETKWLATLTTAATSKPLDERLPILLGLKDEALRIQNGAAVAEIGKEIERTALSIWARDASPDDARTLTLASKLRASATSAPALEAAIRAREASVDAKIRGFSVRGDDGDYVRNRLRYAFGLVDDVAKDPHPVDLGLVVAPSSRSVTEPLADVRGVLAARRGRSKVDVDLAPIRSTTSVANRSVPKTLGYTETYVVHEDERVVKRAKRMVQVGTRSPVCNPTYYSTGTTTHTRRDGSRYAETTFAQGTPNCVGGGEPVLVEEEYETVDFVPRTRTATRTLQERVTATVRTTVLSYSVKATFEVAGYRSEVAFQDRVELVEESYAGTRSAEKSSFSSDVDKQLASAAVKKIAIEVEKLAIQTSRAARIQELRLTLDTPLSEVDRDHTLAELASLEVVPSKEVLARLREATTLPEPPIVRALVGQRIDRAGPVPALPRSALFTLPPPDAEAEKEAFVSEEREYVRRSDYGGSGGVFLGAGAVQFPSGPAFPYASLTVALNATPSFLLFRSFTAGAFLETSLGLGKAIPLSGVAGINAGVRLGPLTVSALGLGGGDAVIINRDDLVSPNEPDVSGAPLLGYGARLSLKTEAVNVVATARRHHRFLAGPKIGYVGELRVGHGVGYLSARYDTYREIFDGDASRVPWSFTGAIGIFLDFADTKVGDLGVRPKP